MGLPLLLIAVILGVVEGATEFLPVSSTGHLIVVSTWLGYVGAEAETFNIVIQFGAILAVIWHYRQMLLDMLRSLRGGGPSRRLVGNLLAAFLPAVVIGLMAHDWIRAHLFAVEVVGWALIVGGLVMLLLEWRRPTTTADSVEQVTLAQATGIGFAQLLAMIPGTSRSASTILGGYVLGLSRAAATEFSFLLAIPTISGAAALDAFKSREVLASVDPLVFATGLIVSFVVALLAIRVFLRYVRSHSFAVFAWYRIAFGGLILLLARGGTL